MNEVNHYLYKKGSRIYEVLPIDDTEEYAAYFYTDENRKHDPEQVTLVTTVKHPGTQEEVQESLDRYAQKQGLERYDPEAELLPPGEEDTGYPEDDPEESEEEQDIQAGKRVSLLDTEFSSILYAADDKINRALRMAIDARQGFTANIKIQFMPTGNMFRVKHRIGYQFDPIKVEDKGELFEDIPITLDEEGNPIIPTDRQHQLSFEDQAQVPGMTTITDQDGVVQNVEIDSDVYPCDIIDCPLYTGYNGITNGCSFCGNTDSPLDAEMRRQIFEAVTVHKCPRPCMSIICEKEFPADDQYSLFEDSVEYFGEQDYESES